MTAETARPVRPADLPAGAVCALTPTGRLSHDDAWQIARFTRLLADKSAVMAEYADTLGPITPAHAYAALHPIPALHAGDPDLVRLWRQRAGRLRELYRAYDAETRPEPQEGDHGTCAYLVGRGAEGTAVCGYGITLRAERTVLMADGTDGHGAPGGREILVWRHTDVAIDCMHRAQIGGPA